MKLLKPNIQYVSAYRDPLRKEWSPDNLRPNAAEELLAKISKDAAYIVSNLDDPTAKTGPVTLPTVLKCRACQVFFVGYGIEKSVATSV